MSLSVEIVDTHLSAEGKSLFAYELPSPSHFQNSDDIFGRTEHRRRASDSREPSPARGDKLDQREELLKHWSRSDSACEILDDRPRVAILTTTSASPELVDGLDHQNNLGVFHMNSNGIEPMHDSPMTPTVAYAGSNDFEFENAEYFVVAVPTAVFLDRTVDASALEHALKSVARHAKQGSTIIIESTVPVGTTRRLLEPLMQSKQLKGGISPKRPTATDHLCPTSDDTPQKLIAGLDDITPGSLASIHSLYADAFPNLIAVSSPEVAEMATLYESGQRMIAMAYANEMADACAPIGVDPFEVCAVLSSRTPSYSVAEPATGFGSFWPAAPTIPPPGARLRLARLVAKAR